MLDSLITSNRARTERAYQLASQGSGINPEYISTTLNQKPKDYVDGTGIAFGSYPVDDDLVQFVQWNEDTQQWDDFGSPKPTKDYVDDRGVVGNDSKEPGKFRRATTSQIENDTEAIQDGELYYDSQEQRGVLGSIKQYLVGFRDVFIKRNSIEDLIGDTPNFWEFLFGARPTRNVIGFYPDTEEGGGEFVWKPNESKANHNGGTIINPDHNSTIGSDNWYSATGDATDTTGSGCWVRPDEGFVNVKWFGAKGDGSNDDTKAIQSAIDIGKRTIIPNGTFKITSTIIKSQSFKVPFIIGNGYKYSIIDGSSLATSTPLFLIKGGSGQFSGGEIKGLAFNGTSSTYGVEVQGQCGLNINLCQFGDNAIGIRLHNKDSGEFTEYVTAEQCDFEASCKKSLTYEVTNGHESFHGSGFIKSKINEGSGATAENVTIGAGALVYNAPFDVQVFKRTEQPFIQHSGNTKSNTYGTITCEPFMSDTGRFSLCGGNTLYHNGNVTSFGDQANLGDLLLVNRVQVNGNGLVSYERAKRYIKETATSEHTDINLNLGGGESALVYVLLQASNYQYEQLVLVSESFAGFSGTGNAVIISTQKSFDNAGLGAPSYSYNSGGLRISNSNYSNVSINASITYLGSGKNNGNDLFE